MRFRPQGESGYPAAHPDPGRPREPSGGVINRLERILSMSVRYRPGTPEFLSCQQLERGTLHFSYEGSLKACCRRDFIDMPEISPYGETPLDVALITERIDAIRRSNNGEGEGACHGCAALERKAWPETNAKYLVNQAIVLNHFTLCNHKCSYCDIYSNKKPLDITPVLNRLFEQGAVSPNATVIIGGGEPALLKGQLRAIIEMSRNNGNPIAIATNSSVFSEDIHDFLKTERRPASSVMTSLDAGTREDYARKHGRDDFDKVLANLARYNAVAEKTRVIVKYIVSGAPHPPVDEASSAAS